MNLLNTCYRCQLAEHKIKDCPLALPRVESSLKEAPTKPVEGKKEEWITVGHKGKAPLTPFSPKQSFAVVTMVPPIAIGSQTPASLVTHTISMEPMLGTLQVSNSVTS